MSMAQMGVILCKLSGRGRRYERTMDFGNRRAAGLAEISEEIAMKKFAPLRVKHD
jgi:hypothetical protein